MADRATLLFDKWDVSQVEVHDVGIQRYVNLSTSASMHTGGRHNKQQFIKTHAPIVERLINRMMMSEQNTGKKNRAYNIIRDAFEIIHKKTGDNPLQVLINAIENAAPREETVRLRYGGISVPKTVDTSPQRRVDAALEFIARGAQKAAFKSRRSIEECLASEIVAAANHDIKAYSIGKKDERERIAKAAR